MLEQTLIIFTDGGARGNPGPAGIGVVLYKKSASEQGAFGDAGVKIGRASCRERV